MRPVEHLRTKNPFIMSRRNNSESLRGGMTFIWHNADRGNNCDSVFRDWIALKSEAVWNLECVLKDFLIF